MHSSRWKSITYHCVILHSFLDIFGMSLRKHRYQAPTWKLKHLKTRHEWSPSDCWGSRPCWDTSRTSKHTEKNTPAECRSFSETSYFFPVFSSPILVYGYLYNQQCWFMEKMVSPRINRSLCTKNGGTNNRKLEVSCWVCHISWKTLGLKKRTPHTHYLPVLVLIFNDLKHLFRWLSTARQRAMSAMEVAWWDHESFIPIGSTYTIYMVTFAINIPQMLAYIYHTWILWSYGIGNHRPVLHLQ